MTVVVDLQRRKANNFETAKTGLKEVSCEL